MKLPVALTEPTWFVICASENTWCMVQEMEKQTEDFKKEKQGAGLTGRRTECFK
jgi:hypothetical protein